MPARGVCSTLASAAAAAAAKQRQIHAALCVRPIAMPEELHSRNLVPRKAWCHARAPFTRRETGDVLRETESP